MKKLIFLFLGFILLGNLFGLVTTQQVNFNTFVSGTIGPFNYWNSPGSLTGVTVELHVTSEDGFILADNDDDEASATISYQLGTYADISTNASGPELLWGPPTGIDLWFATASHSDAGIVLPAGPNASDWVKGDFSSDAPDGMIYNGLLESTTISYPIGPTWISEYASTGTYYFDITTQAITNVTFTAGSGEQAAQSASISGYVKVIYTDDYELPVILSYFTGNFAMVFPP